MTASMYGVRSIGIAKFLWMPMRPYQNQYRRPVTTELTGDIENHILNSATNTHNITPNFIGRHGGSFIRVSADIESHLPVDIANGWNTPRVKFVMLVVIQDQMGSKRDLWVSGYSESSEVRSLMGSYDPDQKFFINNISEVRTTQRNTPGYGVTSFTQVVDSSQIIANPNYQGIFNKTNSYSLKPDVVVKHMGYADIAAEARDGWTHDGCAVIGSMAGKVKRKYGMPSVYASDIINGYYQLASMLDTEHETHGNMLENLAVTLESEAISEDMFMKALRNVQSRRGFGAVYGNTFTMADLMAMDPTMDQRIQTPVDLMSKITHSTPDPLNTNPWGGSEAHTRFAATISSSIPSLISQYGFTAFSFNAHNHTTNSEIIVGMVNYSSYNQGVDLSKQITSLEHRIRDEILFGLAYGMSFEITVMCDMNSDTFIDMTLNGQQAQFTFPSFCDGLMSTLVTGDANRLDNVSRDMNHLMTRLAENSPGSLMRNLKDMGGFDNGMPSAGTGTQGIDIGNLTNAGYSQQNNLFNTNSKI